MSRIDKQIKNTRLAIQRTHTPEQRTRAEKRLEKLLVRKEQLRITER